MSSDDQLLKEQILGLTRTQAEVVYCQMENITKLLGKEFCNLLAFDSVQLQQKEPATSKAKFKRGRKSKGGESNTGLGTFLREELLAALQGELTLAQLQAAEEENIRPDPTQEEEQSGEQEKPPQQ